jgi:hypothetical protein
MTRYSVPIIWFHASLFGWLLVDAGHPAGHVAAATGSAGLKTILVRPAGALGGGALSPAAAAAAVSSDSSSFAPDAWEAAAEAAAVAAADSANSLGVEDLASAPEISARLAATPDTATPDTLCWIVQLLAESLQKAAQADFAATQPTAAAAAAWQHHTASQLSLLPAAAAVAQLRVLDPAERVGLLLLLVLGDVSRGQQWLLLVLAGMTGGLGLAEAGVLLAAVYHRSVAIAHHCSENKVVVLAGRVHCPALPLLMLPDLLLVLVCPCLLITWLLLAKWHDQYWRCVCVCQCVCMTICVCHNMCVCW